MLSLSRASFALAALLAQALLGCTGADASGPSTTTTVKTGASCADLAPSCAADQLGCVEDAKGARCATCGAGQDATSAGTCEAIGGTPKPHDFPDLTVASGEEQLGSCRSWKLDNAEELWVSAVELTQTEESHHSNWVFVPDTMYDGPDGIFTCKDRGYEFYNAVNAGGLLYSQSTQATHEVQRFGAGAAIRIPPHARILSDVHLLNTSPDTVTGHAKLTLYTLAAAEVTTPLAAFHVEYDALALPPHASSRFTGRCAVASDVAAATGAPFAPKVHYLLPHTHQWATGFFAEVLGGPRDGEKLVDVGAYNGEAHGKRLDPPVDLAGSDGLRFGCQYQNDGPTTIGWGFGGSEMCELFGFAEGAPFFQSRVGTGSAAGTDGAVQLFEGDCSTQVFSGP